jgi:hypothetical protein
MAEIILEVPQKALDAISSVIAAHNKSTGAALELTPFLERHLVELAAQPAFQALVPSLETARDTSFQASVQDAMEEIIGSFDGATP